MALATEADRALAARRFLPGEPFAQFLFRRLEGCLGDDHRALPGRGDGTVVFRLGRRPRARGGVPPVPFRPGGAHQRGAGGVRGWLFCGRLLSSPPPERPPPPPSPPRRPP